MYVILGRVAAGAVAEKFLKEAYGTEIVAFVSSVGKVAMPFIEEQSETGVPSEEFVEMLSTITRESIDTEATRCPDKEISKKMTQVRQTSEGQEKPIDFFFLEKGSHAWTIFFFLLNFFLYSSGTISIAHH